MTDLSDTKELIDDAINAGVRRTKEENEDRTSERSFRNRISVLIGFIAVSLAIVHIAATGAARESLLKGIGASHTSAYMQAKIVRETVLKTVGAGSAGEVYRLVWASKATRLRAPDRAQHGIAQSQTWGEESRREGETAAMSGEGYEEGEAGLQIAIALLSIALIARSRPVVAAACALAISGFVTALAAKAGLAIPWIR